MNFKDIQTMADALYFRSQSHGEQVAIRFYQGGDWNSLTWSQYLDFIARGASVLKDLGVQKGDRVAILSNTRWEWAATDLAIMSLGAVTVPIYHSSVVDEISYILENSEAKIVFIENDSLLQKWNAISARHPHVKKIIGFDTKKSDVPLWRDLLKEQKLSAVEYFGKQTKNVNRDDLASIVYTSGTTGWPKGAMLQHRQILSEVAEAYTALDLSDKDTSLAFLPFSHVLGRLEVWGQIVFGYTVGYAEHIERIRDNILQVRPTALVAVPRIFEKIYLGLHSQLEANTVKKKIFTWALEVGRKALEEKRKGRPLALSLVPQLALARELVFKKVQRAMGGRLRIAISGGAPLNVEIAEFFEMCGILVCEGYGLTETTGAICVNTPFANKHGTVGKPIGDVEIKLASDGEILVKSDKVMKGYYKDESATQEVFDGDYLKTGDIGEWVDGYLKITDRKKDLIKTAGGKYVAPQKLEGLLQTTQYVSHALIHGDQRKYIVALLSPNFDGLRKYAQSMKIKFEKREELVDHPQIHLLFKKTVTEVNGRLASYETIKKFVVLPSEFTIENGELTPSLKVKRKFCDSKYRQIIDGLYS